MNIKKQIVILSLIFSFFGSIQLTIASCSLQNLKECNREGLVSIIKELILSRCHSEKDCINADRNIQLIKDFFHHVQVEEYEQAFAMYSDENPIDFGGFKSMTYDFIEYFKPDLDKIIPNNGKYRIVSMTEGYMNEDVEIEIIDGKIVISNGKLIVTEEVNYSSGLKMILKNSQNERQLVLSVDGRELIIEDYLIEQVSFNSLSFLGDGNYVSYRVSFLGGHVGRVYDIKNKRTYSFSMGKGEIVDSNKYLFGCAACDYSSDFYGKVYDLSSGDEIYSLIDEIDARSEGWADNLDCSYDQKRNVIIFKQVKGNKLVEYNLNTRKSTSGKW